MVSPPAKMASAYRNREQDICFSCKQKGHWASHCPSKSPLDYTCKQQHQQQQQRVFLDINGRRFQQGCLVCPNCGLPCLSLVSLADRPYFRCPSNKVGNKDCFFKWGDEVKGEQLVNVPICSCGAAACRLTTPTTGPFAGLPLFICPIKKGQGACSFSQPLNAELISVNSLVAEERSSPRSTLTICGDTSPAKSKLHDEGNLLKLGIETAATDGNIPQCQENCAVTLYVKRDNEMLVLIEKHEDASNDLRKHFKHLRHAAPEKDSSLFDYATDKEHPELDEFSREELTKIAQLENNFGHVESSKEMPDVGIMLPAAFLFSSSLSTKSARKLLSTAAKRKLGIQLHDWLGRLAFSPSWSLINPVPKPFFCCIFPSFDPIYAPKHVNKVCVEVSGVVVSESPLSPPDQDHHSNLLLWDPCPRSDPEAVEGNFMTTTILEGFAQLAAHLQNKLLSVLEMMDFHDHGSMAQEATLTFDALEQLKIDHEPLRAKVKDFIDHALSLAQMEGAIQLEQSSHELVVENWRREKIQLDEISRAYATAETDLEASRKRLESLGEEASRLRDMLFHVEAELVGCDAENENLESRYADLSEKKLASEERVEIAFAEAEKAAKVCGVRVEEKDVAEAAFKKAKILLRK